MNRTEVNQARWKDEREKRIFSDLRLRRKPNKAPIPQVHGKERIARQIDRLEAEFDMQRKKAEVKRKSRSKSRAFRSVSRKLLQTGSEKENEPVYPPQSERHVGLFFRVEGGKSRSVDSPIPPPSPSVASSVRKKVTITCQIPFGQIKDEIESQMIAISSKLKEMHSAPSSPQRKLLRTRSNFDCEFAASVRRPRELAEKAAKPAVSITDETIKHLVNVISKKFSLKPGSGRSTPALFQRFFLGRKAN